MDGRRNSAEGGGDAGGLAERRAAACLVLAALLAATGGCSSEPSTVQLVLRAEPGLETVVTEVEVTATGSIRVDPANIILCRPCSRTFRPEGGRLIFPIVVDLVRGTNRYEQAWFILTYRTATWEGVLYHPIDFPESGLASHEVRIQESCVGIDCGAGLHCLDGACYDHRIPTEVVTGAWTGPYCAAECRPTADADADVDRDADLDVDDDDGGDADVIDDDGAVGDAGP